MNQEKRMADASTAITNQVEMEDEVERLEGKLKIAKSKLNLHNTEETPLTMTLAGITEFTMKNGFKVKVAPFVSGSIDKEEPGPAYDALREVGEDSIIKWTVEIVFGMDEEPKAMKLVQVLELLDYEPAANLAVHAGSLKAAFKRQLLTPGFPLTTVFKGFAGQKATIKRPKV